MVYRKRALKLTALAVVMVLIFAMLDFFLRRTSVAAEMHIQGFYLEPDNTLDVAIIGASECYTDFSPPLAYRDYGFTSYNLCYEGMPGCLYDSVFKEFIKNQDPQLVVFEVNGFFYSEELSLREGGLRNWLDNVKHTDQWESDIKEYVPEDERINYYFNFFKYHDSWYRMEGGIERLRKYSRMNEKGVSMMKSFATRTTNHSYKQVPYMTPEHVDPYGKKSLQELIDCLKENGVKNALFIRTPHTHPIHEAADKELEEIITNGGYDYVNFDNYFDETGVDKKTDFYNADHMNIFGNEKFTKYFGKYIMDHYDINTDHDQKTKDQWDECVEYTENAFEILKERTLTNEDILYTEFTDLSEEHHKKLIIEQKEEIRKASEKKKHDKDMDLEEDV